MMLQFHHQLPRLGNFIGIAGPKDDQSRDGPQAREMLDGLMGGAVFSYADRVVREDVDHGDFHNRAEADGRPHVVGEDEESRAERSHLGEGHAVDARRPSPFRGCRSACFGRGS